MKMPPVIVTVTRIRNHAPVSAVEVLLDHGSALPRALDHNGYLLLSMIGVEQVLKTSNLFFPGTLCYLPCLNQLPRDLTPLLSFV